MAISEAHSTAVAANGQRRTQAVIERWGFTPGERGYEKANRALARIRVLIRYGGECAKCGCKDARVLQIDHVNGGGRKEDKEAGRSSTAYYRRVLEASEGIYQLLCANCNWIKRTENGELNQHAPSWTVRTWPL